MSQITKEQLFKYLDEEKLGKIKKTGVEVAIKILEKKKILNEEDEEYEGEDIDYDVYGDTRNRKGKLEDGYSSHNKGFKEQKRIYYAKEKRKLQSEEDLKKNEVEEEEEKDDRSKKRVLKGKIDESDENYGNNYTPIEKNKKKSKKPQKDRVRF